MKRTSLIFLIVALAAVLVCTGVGAAFVMQRAANPLALEQEGDKFSEEVSLAGLTPGQTRAQTYRGRGTGMLTITLTGDDGALADYLTVTISVGEQALYAGSLKESYGVDYSVEVSGEYTFSVRYTMSAEVGNEAQGAVCNVSALYRLEGIQQ